MTFDEVLTQVRELLEREGRVSYRALKRRFSLDDDYLEDIKDELIKAKQLARDEDGAVLVWGGTTPVSGSEFKVSGPRPPVLQTANPSRSRSASWREFERTDREQGRVRSRRSPGCRSHGRRRSQLRRSANVSCSGWQRHQQDMTLRYAEGERGCHHNQCLPCPRTERPSLPHSSGTSERLT